MVRKRQHGEPSQSKIRGKKASAKRDTDTSIPKNLKQKQNDMAHSKWLMLAIASGTFAAMNGLFAKLTTTTLTTEIAKGVSNFLGTSGGAVEYIIRAMFFGLNILCNIIMWALFTRALTASPSTTKVTITNTSANFLVTGLLGMVVFAEPIGGLWWLGAAAMAAGCILVGMREEKGAKEESTGGEEGGVEEERAILLEGLDDDERR